MRGVWWLGVWCLMIRRRALITLLLSLAGFAICAEARAEAITGEVRLVGERSVSGTIAAIDSDGLSLIVDGRMERIARDDLLAIDFANGEETPAARSWLFLSNGDRVPLSPVELADDQIHCRWATAPDAQQWSVPLELMTGVLQAPLNPSDPPLLAELSSRAFREDTLILTDGSRLTGALEGMTAGSYRMETAVGLVTVESARIAGVGMNAALVQRPDRQEESVLVLTRDGAWLTLNELVVRADGNVVGRTSFDAEFRARLGDIRSISFYGPRVNDLTLREPEDVTATPFVSRIARMLVNRNSRGGFLRLNDSSFARGFGMTSGMSATFELEPADRRFQVTVGIDDSVGDEGSVVFAVDLDGRRVFTSPIQTGRDAPLAVGPLDVVGGQRLTLIVEFAESGNVQDVADWCDPVILR